MFDGMCRVQLKSDLRGIETTLNGHLSGLSMLLKSDLRGIETGVGSKYGIDVDTLKSDLRGIETNSSKLRPPKVSEVKIRP